MGYWKALEDIQLFIWQHEPDWWETELFACTYPAELPDPGDHIVYRHLGIDHQLLYVGLSSDFVSRQRSHLRSTPWREEIQRITFDFYLTREDAAQAESRAIKNENPLYNKAGR